MGGCCNGRCLIYFIAIWDILWLFGIFSPRFGILNKKSGNPGRNVFCKYKKFKKESGFGKMSFFSVFVYWQIGRTIGRSTCLTNLKEKNQFFPRHCSR
jgi:hypothetical protein